MQVIEAGKRIALKEILFATDLSPCANAALPYAISLARRYGATLHAAYVEPRESALPPMSPESWPVMLKEIDRRAEGYVEQLEEQLRSLPHTILTPKGDVTDALAYIIEERDIDLLVLGTHGRSGICKLLLGSVAEEIFWRATCAVMSVGPYVPCQPNGKIQFYNILFATDFGDDSLAALPYAVSLAEEDQAQLTLLHVVEHPATDPAHIEKVKAPLMRALKALVPSDAEPWCHTECLIEFRQQDALPAERILEVSRARGADLIVLGARSADGKLGLGTHVTRTTTQMVTQAACPVLTVRDQYGK